MPTKATDHPLFALIKQRCAILGRSSRTLESYGHRLICFENWIGGSVLATTQEQGAAWLACCASRGDSRHTLYHNRCGLSFLWRELIGTPLDPRIVPCIRRPPLTVREVVGPEVLARLFAAVRDPRVRLFCQFVYATGLRTNEALSVRVRDLDLCGRAVIVTHGKGGRVRRSILPDGIIRLIMPAISRHHPEALLFTANGRPDGRPLSPEWVNRGIFEARQRIGLHAEVTVHRLRHSFATHLHERGAGLVELQNLLGHSTPLITMVYLGLREQRRAELAEIGDLIAALPPPAQEQQRIAFGGGLV